jgi:hypothetical protein
MFKKFETIVSHNFERFRRKIEIKSRHSEGNIRVKVELLIYSVVWRRRDSAGGIATGYGLDDRRVGVQVLVGARLFSSTRY